MKCIYVKLMDSFRILDPVIVEATKKTKQYAIKSLDPEEKFIPTKAHPRFLIPYSDETYKKIMDIKQKYHELWEQEVELSQLTLYKTEAS